MRKISSLGIEFMVASAVAMLHFAAGSSDIAALVSRLSGRTLSDPKKEPRRPTNEAARLATLDFLRLQTDTRCKQDCIVAHRTRICLTSPRKKASGTDRNYKIAASLMTHLRINFNRLGAAACSVPDVFVTDRCACATGKHRFAALWLVHQADASIIIIACSLLLATAAKELVQFVGSQV